jgi:transcriptional regulator with XRE-family HTH domain
MPSPVRGLRHAHGWTVEDLAARAGISARTIYNIEGGHRQPHRSTRRLLALALNCQLEELAPEQPPGMLPDDARPAANPGAVTAHHAGVGGGDAYSA